MSEQIKETEIMQKRCSLLKWIVGCSTGVSSITMWTAIMDIDISDIPKYRFDIPSDRGDFSRCLNLYNKCGLCQDDLDKVVTLFPEWKNIVDNWQILTDMYNNNNSHFYKYIKALTQPD